MVDLAIGIGLGSFADRIPSPEELFHFVERADELGIDSIWMPDHVISDTPEFDPAVLMSMIAARTDDIKMGPSVLTLPARNPVAVANTCASLDHLTGGRGRVILGVGLGADPRVCEAIGVPPEERAPRLREALELVRLLWTTDDVEYDGEYYQVSGVSVTPKPDGGSLDVWIGGNSDAALRRVARYGDGWFPTTMPPEEFAEKHDRLMAYCDEAGRVVERDEAGMVLLSHVADDRDRAATVRDRCFERRGLTDSREAFEASSVFGTPEACVETIQRYVDAGCTKFVLMPVGPVSERIDQIERYSREIIPSVTEAN